MHLVWKRPDGFHQAEPNDYRVIELGRNFKLWLHKTDHDQFPFRIDGGWEEKDNSVLLNNLVNLLDQDQEELVQYLQNYFDHSMKDDRSQFIADILSWIQELQKSPKGDTWEVEIMTQAMQKTFECVNAVKESFSR